MKGWFVEPSVMLLAIGAPHPMRAPCRAFLSGVADRGERVHMSVEGGQEFLFHRMRIGGAPDQALNDYDRLERSVVWHDFTLDVIRAARDLVATGEVRGRDAVHAATAMLAGFTEIVSTDRDFDNIAGIKRVDPRDLSDEPATQPAD